MKNIRNIGNVYNIKNMRNVKIQIQKNYKTLILFKNTGIKNKKTN
jgi:hypothetical protein